jgi:hypothetical protein
MVHKDNVVKLIDVTTEFMIYCPMVDEEVRVWCNLALFVVMAQRRWKDGLTMLVDTLFSYTGRYMDGILGLDSGVKAFMSYQINWYKYSYVDFWSIIENKKKQGVGLRTRSRCKKFREGFLKNLRSIKDREELRRPKLRPIPQTPYKQQKNPSQPDSAEISTVKIEPIKPKRDLTDARELVF